MDFSPIQIAIVLVIALLVFGPKRLPELGKSLGQGIRSFKDSITGGDDDEDDKPQIEQATVTPAATAKADPVDAEPIEHKA